MKPFRIGTMCQLIEIICHSTQNAAHAQVFVQAKLLAQAKTKQIVTD